MRGSETTVFTTGVVPIVANPFVAKSWPLYVSGQLFAEKKVGHNGYNPCN